MCVCVFLRETMIAGLLCKRRPGEGGLIQSSMHRSTAPLPPFTHTKTKTGELTSIRKYRDGIASLSSDIKGNPQTDLYSRVRKELDVSSLRDSLNKVNTVFSEDTQRGTDRLVRIILQDVNELEVASRQVCIFIYTPHIHTHTCLSICLSSFLLPSFLPQHNTNQHTTLS